MEKQKQFLWIPILLSGSIFVLLCVWALAVGGGAAYGLSKEAFDQKNGGVKLAALKAPVLKPTLTPTTTSYESDYSKNLTGEQRYDENSLFDDFSSDAFAWWVGEDDFSITEFENEAYVITEIKPDQASWSSFPVDFIPTDISFDAKGPDGEQNGTFGIYCQMTDENNYYFVIFDLSEKTYLIGQTVDKEDINLTKKNKSGNYWQEASSLKTPATEVNHFKINCNLDSIQLTINDKLIDEVQIEKPFENNGKSAFYVYANKSVDKNGYKIVFDNLEISEPVD